MPKKKDSSITFLNSFGYNVIKLPRAGIEPLDIIGRDDATQWLGPLATVWKSHAPQPVPTAPRPAAPINGQKTDQLDLSFGLKILSSALAAFGASSPSLDVGFKRARKIQFSYTNVTSTAVAPLDAGNYLASGTLNTANPVVEHFLTGEDTQAFLIVDVLKSTSLTVSASDEHNTGVTLDAGEIQQMVGAKVGVQSSGAASNTLTFTSEIPVTFGFAVDEIDYDGARWTLRGAAPSGSLAFGTGAPQGGVAALSSSPIILGAGCRVRI